MLIDCTTGEVTRPAIEQALTEDNLLWLDIWDTDEDTIALLGEVFSARTSRVRAVPPGRSSLLMAAGADTANLSGGKHDIGRGRGPVP